MSLLFDASGELVTVTANASINTFTEATMVTWMKLNTPTNTFPRLFDKLHLLGLQNDVADNLSFQHGRATDASWAEAVITNFAHFAYGTWMYIVGQYDGVTAANSRLLVGNRTSPAAEPSSYSAQLAGSGAYNDHSASDLIIGNRASPTNRQLDGLIWFFSLYNRWLTTPEIHAQRFHQQVLNGCVLFCYPGHPGYNPNPTTEVRDLSGNGNHGTITNATVDSDEPFPIRTPVRTHVSGMRLPR